MIDALRQDLSYAVRRLRQAPGFTLVVAHARARHRRDERHLQRRERGPAAPAALPRARPAGDGGADVEGPAGRLLPAELPRRRGRRRPRSQALAAIDTNGVTLTGQGARRAARGGGGERLLLRRAARAARSTAAASSRRRTSRARNKVVVLGYPLWRDRFGADPGSSGGTVQLEPPAARGGGRAPPGFSLSRGRRDLDADGVRRALPHEQPRRLVPDRRRPARDGRQVDGARQEVSTIAARLAQELPGRTTRASAAP